jgi:hypothetical protein
MDPDQRRFGGPQVAHHDRDVLEAVVTIAVAEHGELAGLGREPGLPGAHDGLLAAAPVGDQLTDLDLDQTVLGAEPGQLRRPGHLTVGAGDLADHRGRSQPGQAHQVDRGLGVAGPPQHPALPVGEGEHVSRLAEVGVRAAGIGQRGDRPGPVRGRDPGGRPVPDVDADVEGGLPGIGRIRHHRRYPELIEAIPRHRHTDQAAAVRGHEVHGRGRDVLGGHDQIALVLPVRRVDDHDQLAPAERLDGGLDPHPPRLRRAGGGGRPCRRVRSTDQVHHGHPCSQ